MICTVWEGYKDSLSVLTRNQLFFKLALIMAASGIVFECIMDLLFNYLIVTMGFQAEQNGNVLMILGICGLIVQVPHTFLLNVNSNVNAATHVIRITIALDDVCSSSTSFSPGSSTC